MLHKATWFQVSTKVVPKQPLKKEVEWWVILLSILGGIIFILILVVILHKVGVYVWLVGCLVV